MEKRFAFRKSALSTDDTNGRIPQGGCHFCVDAARKEAANPPGLSIQYQKIEFFSFLEIDYFTGDFFLPRFENRIDSFLPESAFYEFIFDFLK